MLTGRVFRHLPLRYSVITVHVRLHLALAVSIRRSCAKRVLGAGRYRAKVLPVATALRPLITGGIALAVVG
jgi:hypothetical protein